MASKFTVTDEFLGYQTRSNILNSDPRFLSTGSQNMIVDWNASLVQRGGIVQIGADGSSGNNATGAYTWRTSRGVEHVLRAHGTAIQRKKTTTSGATITYTWENVISGLTIKNSFISFAPVWVETQGRDFLVVATGNQYINYWGGAYATVASTTASTVTIDGIRSLIELGFNPQPPVGYDIKAVSAGTFSYTGMTTSDTTTESVGTVSFDTGTDIVTINDHGLSSNTPIKFTTTGTLPTGLTSGTQYYPVSINQNTFQVSETPNGAVIDLTGTPSGTHTVHKYTGIIDTFTGVTFATGTPSAGESLMEQFLSQTNSSMDFPAEFTIDHVGTYKSQLHIGCERDRRIFISNAISDGGFDYPFVNFTTGTTPGSGEQLTLDDSCKGFVANKDVMLVFGADESVFKITVTLSADQTKQFRDIERLETAGQQGIIGSKFAVRVKNAIVYITKEKTLDTIKFVENIADIQSIPISDIIKSDFDAADFTGGSIFYWNRSILIATPASTKVFMYDLQRQLWHSPFVFTGATIAYFSTDEDGNLIGHDAFKDQSYKMFIGYSDNGQAILSIAKFSYNFFGDRYAVKRFTKYIQDGFITANGVLKRTLLYNYKGQSTPLCREFSGGDRNFAYYEPTTAPLGTRPIGERSLSGSSLTDIDDQRRFRYSDSVPPQDFFELQVVYEMNVNNNSWRLIAHGADLSLSGSDVNTTVRDRTY